MPNRLPESQLESATFFPGIQVESATFFLVESQESQESLGIPGFFFSLESWKPGILETWNPGIPESWNPRIPESCG